MHVGIDYTAAVRQRAGIGRYTRELVRALLALPEQDITLPQRYTILAAAGRMGVESQDLRSARNVRVRAIPCRPCTTCRSCTTPATLSPSW
jgi:hypothetical protein